MKIIPIITKFATVAVVAFTPSLSAAVLAGWDFNGLSSYGPSPFAATTTATNLTVVGLTRGSGIGTTGTAAGNAWGGVALNETSLADAINGNDIVTLTMTVGSAYTMSISEIGPYNIRRSSTGATTGLWQYQVGSGSFVTIGNPISWGTTTSASGNSQGAINLSAVTALQDIAAGTTITIRLAVWGASASTGTWYLNNFQTGDDLIINGTISAVPEPGTALLGGLGLLALLRRRR